MDSRKRHATPTSTVAQKFARRALDLPLLELRDAYTLAGCRVRYHGGKIDKEIERMRRAAERCASAASGDERRTLEQRAAEAEAAVLREEVQMKLPQAGGGAAGARLRRVARSARRSYAHGHGRQGRSLSLPVERNTHRYSCTH